MSRAQLYGAFRWLIGDLWSCQEFGITWLVTSFKCLKCVARLIGVAIEKQQAIWMQLRTACYECKMRWGRVLLRTQAEGAFLHHCHIFSFPHSHYKDKRTTIVFSCSLRYCLNGKNQQTQTLKLVDSFKERGPSKWDVFTPK